MLFVSIYSIYDQIIIDLLKKNEYSVVHVVHFDKDEMSKRIVRIKLVYFEKLNNRIT